MSIVGHSVEQGKQIVFFRVEGIGRRITIVQVRRVIGSSEEDSREGDGLSKPGFWAPSEPMPYPTYGVRNPHKVFGVTAPTNTPVWRLRLLVFVDRPFMARVREMPRGWKFYRVQRRDPWYRAVWRAWNVYESRDRSELQSDLITNEVVRP